MMEFLRDFWEMPHVRWWTGSLALCIAMIALYSFGHAVTDDIATVLYIPVVFMWLYAPVATWRKYWKNS